MPGRTRDCVAVWSISPASQTCQPPLPIHADVYGGVPSQQCLRPSEALRVRAPNDTRRKGVGAKRFFLGARKYALDGQPPAGPSASVFASDVVSPGLKRPVQGEARGAQDRLPKMQRGDGQEFQTRRAPALDTAARPPPALRTGLSFNMAILNTEGGVRTSLMTR